ncbi:hypothetical protein QNA29_37825, partial [Rhodococcus opacus]
MALELPRTGTWNLWYGNDFSGDFGVGQRRRTATPQIALIDAAVICCDDKRDGKLSERVVRCRARAASVTLSHGLLWTVGTAIGAPAGLLS